MLNVIKAYAVKNLCYIAAQKMIPQGIVVHSTGPALVLTDFLL